MRFLARFKDGFILDSRESNANLNRFKQDSHNICAKL